MTDRLVQTDDRGWIDESALEDGDRVLATAPRCGSVTASVTAGSRVFSVVDLGDGVSALAISAEHQSTVPAAGAEVMLVKRPDGTLQIADSSR